MTDYISTLPVQIEYRVERPSISDERRRDLEFQRRQAIALVRFCDQELYGRNDHTIPLKQR